MDYEKIYNLAKANDIDALKQYDAETLATFIADAFRYERLDTFAACLAFSHHELAKYQPNGMQRFISTSNQMLEQENENIQQRIDELEEDVENLTAENDDLSSEVERLRMEIKKKHQGGRAKYSQEDRGAVLKDYRDGMPQRAIAKKHGMSPNTVYRFIRDEKTKNQQK